MKLGYARVSTQDQSLDLQIDALELYGCTKVFTDKVSGKTVSREGLDQTLEFLREGDTLAVWKLDRLGRSLPHLIEVVTSLKERGINFVSLQENIDTSSAVGNLIFHIFCSLAQFERELTRERVIAGLNAARARGKSGGRPKALTTDQIKQLLKIGESRAIPITDLCEQYGISTFSYYNYKKKYGMSK